MSKIFFSYSHDDEELRNQLEKHLASLQHQGLIESWHDRRLVAGTNVNADIDANLADSDIVLLLVSASFLASRYCYGIEMKQALAQHDSGRSRVIPVILRPCEWMSTPLGQLLAVPRDGKPITIWANQDEAMTDVAIAVRKALPEQAQTRPAAAAAAAAASARAAAVASTASSPASAAALASVPALARSSNMRVRSEFSDADKDVFVHATFGFIAGFFEESLKELQVRHAHVEGRFRRISTDMFSAVIYLHGKTRSECAIHVGGGGFGGRQSIAYSPNSGSPGTTNETLIIEADEVSMYWKPLMGAVRQRDAERLSKEQAADYLWGILMRPLQ